jgi:hypothetical protein
VDARRAPGPGRASERPERMDADGNGIPCESLDDADVVSSVLVDIRR